MARALRPVQVVTGEEQYLGRVGWYDPDSQHVFFGPQSEPVDRDTEFQDAVLAHLLVLRNLTEKRATSTKAKDGVDDAFKT